MWTLTVRLPNGTHERLKDLAQYRGVSVNKLMEELSAISVAQHDAETRFRDLAARESAKERLRVLDKLDDALEGFERREARPEWTTPQTRNDARYTVREFVQARQ